jgi:hypothetical protein
VAIIQPSFFFDGDVIKAKGEIDHSFYTSDKRTYPDVVINRSLFNFPFHARITISITTHHKANKR